MTDPQVLIDCTQDPDGSSPFKWAAESSNWVGLRILIESNLISDKFLDKVETWPECLLFKLATPLATLLSTSPPDLTSEQLGELVRLFVERGSSFDGCSGSLLPPILCQNNSLETIHFLLSHGATLPQESLPLLVAQQNFVFRICNLTRSGFLHPEFLLAEETTLSGFPEMLRKSETQTQKAKLANGMLFFALLQSLTLGSGSGSGSGSGLDLNLVLKLFNILQNHCQQFPDENQSKVFDEIEKRLLNPSTLKVLARTSVRKCLLSERRNDNLSRTIDNNLLDTLPMELRQFLLFSDLDENVIHSFFSMLG